MRHQEAQVVAGQLFGNILLRDADRDGYAHAIDKLQKGVTAAELSREIFCSDEFQKKFVIRNSLIDVARILTKAICGWVPSDQDAESAALGVAKNGIHQFINELFAQRRKYFPPHSIPSMAEVID